MSRSNGPTTRAGGQAPQWRHPESDPASHGHNDGAYQQQQWSPNQQADHQQYSYPYDQGQGGVPSHQNGAPQQHPAYHYPDQGIHHGQPGYAPQPAPQQPYYDPQQHSHQHQGAEPYAAPFEPQLNGYAQGGYPSQQPERKPHAQPSSLRDQLRGAQHDQWQDQRGYDLGSYMPSSSGRAPSYGHQPAQSGQGWPAQGGGHWQDQDGMDPHRLDGSQDHAGYFLDQPGLPVAAQQHEEDDGDFDLDEPPRPRRRGLLIMTSLVGAIVVGGGLAYTYKVIMGPSSKGAPPVIRADGRPSKVQPTDPGGKQFAHSDMKLMGRLEADGATAGSATPSDDPSGVRKVSTVTIGRDGAIGAPAAEPRLPPPTVSVPGLTLVEGRSQSPMPQRAAEPQRISAPPSNPQAPQVIARAQVAPQAEPETPPIQPKRQLLPPPTAQQPPAAVAAVTVPKKPIVNNEGASAATKSGAGGSAGFVAVLSSQRSRMDALKAFADLQQKYATVLQSKIPDVQEADLSSRGLGTMYRAVVGPPGSREAANDICGQLKSAGYTGCWVTPY